MYIYLFYDYLIRITKIDHQVGLVQTILCDRDDKAHQNACHLLEGTICHLLEHCGDKKQRFTSCEYTVDLTTLAPSVMTFIKTYFWFLSPLALLLSLTTAFAVVPELL